MATNLAAAPAAVPVQRVADILFAAAGFSFNAQAMPALSSRSSFRLARTGKGEMMAGGRLPPPGGGWWAPAGDNGSGPAAWSVAADADRRLRQRRKSEAKVSWPNCAALQPNSRIASRLPAVRTLSEKHQQQLLDAVEFVHSAGAGSSATAQDADSVSPTDMFNLLCRRFTQPKVCWWGKIRWPEISSTPASVFPSGRGAASPRSTDSGCG